MRKKVFTIKDHFLITGRGLIIVGERADKNLWLRMKMPLIIVKPNGEQLNTYVGGLESFSPPNFKTEAILIHDLTKDDLPIGSEVFVDE
jgi:hypothetical protein